MSEVVVFSMLGALGAGAVLVWVIAGLRTELRQAWQMNRELVARVQAKDPAEYMVWAQHHNGPPPPVPRERRLYDETGLLSVPEDDRLED